MATVPAFALYGDRDGSVLGDWLHCESIPARSGRYDWEIKPHRHPHVFQILHLSGGSGTCLLEGRQAALVPSTAVTVPPGTIHGFRFSPDVRGWVLTLMADRAAPVADAVGLGETYARPQLIPLGDGRGRAGGRCAPGPDRERGRRAASRPGRPDRR